MDMRGLVACHEEGMVVNEILPSIHVEEYCTFLPPVSFTDVQEIRGYKIEVLGIPLELLVKLGGAETKMS